MNKLIVPALLAALAAGAGGGYWFATQQTPSATAHEKEPIYYRNPMNPEITSPVPAKDDMGMDYVPVYAQESRRGRSKGASYSIVAP